MNVIRLISPTKLAGSTSTTSSSSATSSSATSSSSTSSSATSSSAASSLQPAKENTAIIDISSSHKNTFFTVQPPFKVFGIESNGFEKNLLLVSPPFHMKKVLPPYRDNSKRGFSI